MGLSVLAYLEAKPVSMSQAFKKAFALSSIYFANLLGHIHIKSRGIYEACLSLMPYNCANVLHVQKHEKKPGLLVGTTVVTPQ